MFGPKGAKALVEATLAMLAFDVKYRIDHHDDLNAGPAVETTELEPGDSFNGRRLRDHGSPDRPLAGLPDPRLSHRTRWRRRGPGRRHRAVRGARCAVQGRRHLCADGDPRRPGQARAVQRLQDILDYHSTVEQAAQTAARRRSTLMMTHYVPNLMPGQEEAWREIARPHFNGEIVLGDDLTVARA